MALGYFRQRSLAAALFAVVTLHGPGESPTHDVPVPVRQYGGNTVGTQHHHNAEAAARRVLEQRDEDEIALIINVLFQEGFL